MEVDSVGLLTRKDEEAGDKVKRARLQVDLAVLKMDKVLTQVEKTAIKAKEELRGRTA